MQDRDIIAGLDIGTTKVAVIIAEIEGEEVKIVGVGVSPSQGLRRGVVVNLEKTVHSITKAVEIAERMAGVKISTVYAGIAGDHIRSWNARGVVAVSRDEDGITEEDVERAIDSAKLISIPKDQEIVHVLPQSFIVDNQSGIKDPIGMSAIRLEVEVHIVTGAVTSAQNIVKSIQRAGLEVRDLVIEPLASSYAVLDPAEQDLGVVLLDVGGGTTDIAIFYEGSIRHTGVIGLGGQNVTNDIAIGLRTPLEQAEEIKREHCCAMTSLIEADMMITVPGVSGRPPRKVSKQLLGGIVEPRMEELFNLVQREILKSDYDDLLGAGAVITGGGSLMKGTVELAEQILDMPVRLGVPKGFGGLTAAASSPIHATGVGLVLYGLQNSGREGMMGLAERPFSAILKRMKRWFEDIL